MPEPCLFTLIRHVDESGISGTGRVLDGVIFHTGQVVVCWRTDINAGTSGHSSIAIYPSWEAFLSVHVQPHPPHTTEIRFAQFLAVCSRSQWSRPLTQSPLLALRATAGSNAADKIISACSHA